MFSQTKNMMSSFMSKTMCFLIWYSEALDTNVDVNIDTISISVGVGWI